MSSHKPHNLPANEEHEKLGEGEQNKQQQKSHVFLSGLIWTLRSLAGRWQQTGLRAIGSCSNQVL